MSQEYRFISTDTLLPIELDLPEAEQAWLIHEARLKEQRDSYAKKQGAKEDIRLRIAKNILNMTNMPIEEVADVTGLSYEGVKYLLHVEE